MSFLSRRAATISISTLSAAAAAAGFTFYSTRSRQQKMLPSYEATFSVPLECESCVTDIKSALSKVDGITSTAFSIPSSLITITSTTAPSTLISTIQSTGRDAILRGSGAPNSAAVCILEIPPSATTSNPTTAPERSKYQSPVRGLARLIQLSPQLTLMDVTVTALPRGRYSVSVRRTGDISRGASSLGDVYRGEDGGRDGELGLLEVDEKGRGNLVGEVGWRVWELVGRGICVQPVEAGGLGEEEGRGEVVGVVARSAGAWENEKVVCGCSGKTVWEEREEMVGKGMV
ncbi:copper chaperone [Xanthoria calcicola]